MQDAILTICWLLPDNYYLRTYIDSAVQAILIKNRLQNQASSNATNSVHFVPGSLSWVQSCVIGVLCQLIWHNCVKYIIIELMEMQTSLYHFIAARC